MRLGRANFRNRDARGAARGVYRSRHGGAGELDLDARVESAQASSAWRYVPRIVSSDVPRWLKAALQSGHVEGARVRLAGNLDRFPFRDGHGEFRVSGRFHDLRMAYAPGWPALDGLEGDLLFDRAKMEISAERGSVMGSRLASVHAVIPDLELGRLSVEGKALGTTAGFLRFVNASPVANSVGYFTRGVQASGDGALDLKIEVPLANAEKASAHGIFRFEHNRLSLQPRLPELADATGRFEFTDSAFNIPEATALVDGRSAQCARTDPCRRRCRNQCSGKPAGARSGEPASVGALGSCLGQRPGHGHVVDPRTRRRSEAREQLEGLRLVSARAAEQVGASR